LRVLKPGAHLLAFAGTRTQHRMTCAIEDAGFEIRDMIAWVYGSGFPKSLDVSKAIDKAAGAERGVIGERTLTGRAAQSTKDKGGTYTAAAPSSAGMSKVVPITAPATDAAKQWHGWGTALKPALEPITVARKPLDGTVAENVLRYGTGAINVDGCRVGDDQRFSAPATPRPGTFNCSPQSGIDYKGKTVVGRWPANLIHDGSEEVMAGFPETGPSKISNRGLQNSGRHGGLADTGRNIKHGTDGMRGHNDNGGSAARFFYCAKASKAERGEGNNHPTVKPVALMRYLCRLVTPPGGTVLDPFMGSGSTGIAAVLEGFGFIGIERELEYLEIARARTAHALQSNRQQTLPL
jgi:site-specific DNA-methyltransferase (adenine-specific)